MNEFNLPRRNLQKERRAKRAEKRKLRSSAATLKVSSAKQKNPKGISGKKARKLQKKWRQAQKEALQSGLVSMHDIEMMAVDEGSGDQTPSKPKVPKTGRAFLMKKRAKLRLKSSTSKGKQISDPAANPNAEGADTMMQ